MYKKAFYRPLVVYFVTAATKVMNSANIYSTSLLQLYFLRFSPSNVIYDIIIRRPTGKHMIHAYY